MTATISGCEAGALQGFARERNLRSQIPLLRKTLPQRKEIR
jgi:hypothetical protein